MCPVNDYCDMSQTQTGMEDDIFNGKVKKYTDMVAACRQAVGEDFDFVLECHRSLTPSEAIAFGNAVEKYHPLFLEDPIAPDNVEVMADVASKISIPIATGERCINIQEMELIMTKKAARYVRPDVCALGGITPAKKVAAMAEANYVGIVPHNPLGPVSTAACLQLDASIPNFTIQEFPSFYLQGGEAANAERAAGGRTWVYKSSKSSRYWYRVNCDISEKFPPKQRGINAQINYDGSVRDL